MFKIFITLFISLLIFSSIAQAQSSIRKKIIVEKIENELNERGYLNEETLRQNREAGDPSFQLAGVLHDFSKEKDSIVDGIYQIGRGSHTLSDLAIITGENIEFLDLHTHYNFLASMQTALKYFERENYCREIINEYLKRILRIYDFNKNMIIWLSENDRKAFQCSFNKLETKSSKIDLRVLKQNLLDYLLEDGAIESDTPQNTDFLGLERLGVLCGLSKDEEHINEGVYSFPHYFSNTTAKDFGTFFVIVKENDYTIIKTEDFESFVKLFNETISYGEENNIPLSYGNNGQKFSGQFF